jgi:hypothetical protein
MENTVRNYEFKMGSSRRPFTKEQKAEIRRSIREIGVVATADRFNSIPAYITQVARKANMKVNLGRRPQA